MDMELIDGAACAASDLTARLLAELAAAQAQLAIVDARVCAALAQGEELPADLRNDRILCRRQVAVLRQVLDGMPSLDGDCYVASA